MRDDRPRRSAIIASQKLETMGGKKFVSMEP